MVVLKNRALLSITLAVLMAAGLLVAALLVATADRAGAAFPGTNGKIALERGGTIYTLTPGGGVTSVTTGGAVDTDPNWSPKGNLIAFERNTDIHTVTATAPYDVTLYFGPGNNRDPNWSPDGTKIAFASNRNNGAGDFDIYKLSVGAPGTNTGTQITSGAADVDERPAYSPDGTKIAFQRGGNIWTVADGPGLNVDTSNLGQGTAPDWGPGPGPGPDPGGCTITGTSGNDNNLVGTNGPDVICGFKGNDNLKGLQGNDTLRGGRGNDNLDTQDGQNGNDTAKGGRGSDTCTTDPGDTKVSC